MPLQQIILKHLHPKFWPTWIGLFAMWLLGQLPLRILLYLGKMLGRVMYHIGPRRREIAKINLELCFPDKSAAEIQTLLSKMFEEIGISSMEMCASWFASQAKLKRWSTIEGQEHIDAALAQGNGAIMLSGHFCNLEIGACMLASHIDLCAMYRKHGNPLFEAFMRRSRDRLTPVPVLTRNDVRGMVRELKSNLPIWYAPDQDYGRRLSIFVPFFGVNASTVVATARLAKMGKSPVVPYFCERKSDNSGYRLKFYPMLDDFPSKDTEADTIRVNQVIESEILRRPAEYLWVHRRFKTQPEGIASFYPPPKSRAGKARERKKLRKEKLKQK